ncbi:hypothetical protein CPC08DRAFT_704232 [Agrocybe pediades]|nr:hypothetical protein CPC08DRAFT_704232 [Agrocybe pediades]
MFIFILSRVLSAWFAFILPSFATFKALSRRPLSDSDIQKWSIYWAVIGVFVAFEYLAEWLISWLPFYWELKTMFLLFLSLPQTEGSTYIYHTYLQPVFIKNEANLDAGIVAIQRDVLAFVQERLTALWNMLWNLATKNQAQGQTSAQPGSQWSQLFSPELVHSALDAFRPRGTNSDASRNLQPQGSNAAARGSHASLVSENGSTENTPSFPVPQHYE